LRTTVHWGLFANSSENGETPLYDLRTARRWLKFAAATVNSSRRGATEDGQVAGEASLAVCATGFAGATDVESRIF